jgi:hypothetical protein
MTFAEHATLDEAISPALGNRREKSLDITWHHHAAAEEGTLGARYRRHSHFEVIAAELQYIDVTFSKSSEAVAFTRLQPPVRRLTQATRSSAGEIRLAEPHRSTGGSYAFKIYFEPPLRRGDVVDLELEVDFPQYKKMYLDDVVAELLASGAEVRDYDYNSFDVSRPVAQFSYTIVLPKSLGASPLGPMVLRNNVPFLEEMAFLSNEPGVSTTEDVVIGEEECWLMRVNRTNPPFGSSYRMRWKPKRRSATRSALGGRRL